MTRIHFDESSHTYTDTETGEILTPVSSVIAKYKKEFVVTAQMLENAANKYLIPIEKIEDYWELNKKYSQNKGTAIHLLFQSYIEYGICLDDDLFYWLEQFNSLSIAACEFYCEERIYSLEHAVCGTADLVVRSFGTTDIYDFKSNKKLEKTAYKNQKMLGLCSAFEDCNFSHYSIQLSLYARMLEMKGEEIGYLYILYLNPSTKILEKHKVYYYKELATKLLSNNIVV
jgi:ATP-dependent exoDNAse (exonuclease V) beta subunit